MLKLDSDSIWLRWLEKVRNKSASGQVIYRSKSAQKTQKKQR